MSVNLKFQFILVLFALCVSKMDASININVEVYLSSASGAKNVPSEQCVYSTADDSRDVNSNVKTDEAVPMVETTTTEKPITCTGDGYEFVEQAGVEGCYKFHPQFVLWVDANKTCVEEGSNLIVIDKEAEEDLLIGLYEKYRAQLDGEKNYVHVGVYRDESGDWVTVDGRSFLEIGYLKWARLYPLNYPDMIHTTFSLNSKALVNMVNYLKYPFICEKN